jgi:hypothetical protein
MITATAMNIAPHMVINSNGFQITVFLHCSLKSQCFYRLSK